MEKLLTSFLSAGSFFGALALMMLVLTGLIVLAEKGKSGWALSILMALGFLVTWAVMYIKV